MRSYTKIFFFPYIFPGVGWERSGKDHGPLVVGMEICYLVLILPLTR